MAKHSFHSRSAATGKITAGKSTVKNPASKAGAALKGAARKQTNYVVAIQIADRAGAVAAALGSKAQLASMLEVSPSQPTRWIDGSESPNSENARVIVDLDHVIARAGLLWKPTVIGAWLNGSNAFLDGARPIDVLRTTGSAPVIDALDQELAGGYA